MSAECKVDKKPIVPTCWKKKREKNRLGEERRELCYLWAVFAGPSSWQECCIHSRSSKCLRNLATTLVFHSALQTVHLPSFVRAKGPAAHLKYSVITEVGKWKILNRLEVKLPGECRQDTIASDANSLPTMKYLTRNSPSFLFLFFFLWEPPACQPSTHFRGQGAI